MFIFLYEVDLIFGIFILLYVDNEKLKIKECSIVNNLFLEMFILIFNFIYFIV